MNAGTYGVNITIQTGLDLTQSTSLSITIQRPDGSVFTHPVPLGSIIDATKGVVAYLVQQGDLTVAGLYQAQVTDTTNNALLTSTIGRFYVGPSLPNSAVSVTEYTMY